ncbi:MAG: glycosyltransferase family 4 protein [Dehalococcoidia bacterium]|nr:glycosyltransferase family 4 protein [Dehalococcoidia bacterium]
MRLEQIHGRRPGRIARNVALVHAAVERGELVERVRREGDRAVFESRKGLPVLLQAFRILKARRPEVSLVAVGDGARRKEYEAQVRAMGPAGVHFAGYVPGPVLPAYYRHAAAFCAPNTGNESFGIVLLEAMAAGAPVVASDIPGFRAVVTHERNGLLVPPRDPAALAEALDRLLGDSGLAGALSQAGREHAAAFAWPRVAERVLEFYERTAAQARR